jgi:sugar (pentulose or hexulose) kinase
MTTLYAGIDAGTSGVRLCLINDEAELVYEDTYPLPLSEKTGAEHEQEPGTWWEAVTTLLGCIPGHLSGRIHALAIDATSGTLLLTDKNGEPLSPALMYNDARSTEQATLIAAIAPDESGAHGASSSLAKLLWLSENIATDHVVHALHQADWLLGQMTGQFGVSDENNSLKLGYDPVMRSWPAWIEQLDINQEWLPEVQEPGSPAGTIIPELASQFGLPTDMMLCAGTTDSIAAFLATGASQPGEAVTSLGSSLAIKIIGKQALFAPKYGIYSHRLWNQWLIGGASNTGGAVLKHYFSHDQIENFSRCIDPEQATGLDYYPLLSAGERFPVADPELEPRLTPRPENDCMFFQGILEGISRIEEQAYQKLKELGAPWPTSIRSVGGGANNEAWTTLRGNRLGVDMIRAEHDEAAFGAALLARRGIMRSTE